MLFCGGYGGGPRFDLFFALSASLWCYRASRYMSTWPEHENNS
jgi:hypothetical protein